MPRKCTLFFIHILPRWGVTAQCSNAAQYGISITCCSGFTVLSFFSMYQFAKHLYLFGI